MVSRWKMLLTMCLPAWRRRCEHTHRIAATSAPMQLHLLYRTETVTVFICLLARFVTCTCAMHAQNMQAPACSPHVSQARSSRCDFRNGTTQPCKPTIDLTLYNQHDTCVSQTFRRRSCESWRPFLLQSEFDWGNVWGELGDGYKNMMT